jgi:hypothetical protein
MSADWTYQDAGLATDPGIDSAIDWALGAGRGSFFGPGRQQDRIPIVVLLNGISASGFAQGDLFIETDDERISWRASVSVPAFYTDAPADPAPGLGYVTAMVRTNVPGLLQTNARLRGFIARISIGLPLGEESLPPPKPAPKPAAKARP